MNLTSIEKKICIEPKFINSKLKLYLNTKIKEDFLNYCDQDYGYITKIEDDIQIINNVISSSSSAVFFEVKFKATIFKPKVNVEYKGFVCMVFSQGIFVEVFNKMKVLIPTEQMNGYKFNKENSTFSKGTKIISNKSPVNIIIKMIKYEKQNFNCIGSLKN